MDNVKIVIDGIILNCDDSVLGLPIGNGYTIQKVYLDEFPYKDSITNGRGDLNIEYIDSKRQDENGIYFYCFRKEDTYTINSVEVTPGTPIDQDDIMRNDQLMVRKDQEASYLLSYFTLLRVFKEGNIATKNTFFTHTHKTWGFISNTQRHSINSYSYNIADSRQYSLSESEIREFTQFVSDYSGTPFELLKDCIKEFTFGLSQIDMPTAFEQYTTALEMMLLDSNDRQGKKECLSKRTAMLLGRNDADIQTIYTQIKNFYKYRSESLHEGDGRNITLQELHSLETLVRNVLKQFLQLCKIELPNNSNVTWEDIKDRKITQLKTLVQNKIASGVLPR